MGLRFRKTISLLPGVRLNLGKSTQSISVGMPGFRKTFNTKGQVTTTVGLPGTGLYYVDTKNPKKEKQRAEQAKSRKTSAPKSAASEQPRREAAPVPVLETPVREIPEVPRRSTMPSPDQFRRPIQMGRSAAARVSVENLHSIHKSVDDTIPWQEIAALPQPPDPSCNADMWAYYHSVAPAILEGDIDTYLRLIYEVNPLDDLLEYGEAFTFGTDDAARMEVEFRVNEDALFNLKASVSRADYNDILQDFICSMVIRIARDIFALLPVENTVVHAELRDHTVLSVDFDRATMDQIRFGMIDPSDTMAKFRFNMNFDPAMGFATVKRLE